MATVTDTTGLALGNIPLSTVMVDKDATVTLISGASDTILENVSGLISSAVSTAWKAGGSKAPMDLTSSLLVAANEGKVYNMSASGTTDEYFIEGAGKSYAAGTDIAVINDGTAESPVYKFNVLATYDASVVKSITVGASTITPALNGSITFSGTNGVSVHSGGGATVTIDGSGLSGIISGIGSGLDVVSGVASGAASGLSGLKNFSGVRVHSGSGDTGYTPISATSNADTLSLKAGSNVTLVPNTSDKSVTINATVPSGVVTGVVAGSGTASANPSGHIEIHGDNGVSVYASGSAVMVDGSSISGVASGAASGVTELSGVVSGLKNFSKVTVLNSGGTAVTNGNLTPDSNADDTLKLQAGSNVTLSVGANSKTVKIAATVPVTGAKISGESSNLTISGATIVIPWAGSGIGNLGVVGLDDYPDESNNVGTSGVAVAATPAAVATRVSKSVLDTNVTKVSADTQTPASYDTGNTLPNTIYGLIRAIKITNDTAH